MDMKSLCAGLLLAAAPLCGGCIDTDAAVFVEATIEGATATVQQSSLNTALSGALTVNLHLGPRASDASEVSLGSFSLTNADRSVTVVQTLLAGTDPPFPVTVGVDSDVPVAVMFAAADNLLETTAVDQLCAPGGVVFVVALDDSLRGGAITAESQPVPPGGCP